MTTKNNGFWDKEQVIGGIVSSTGKSLTRVALVEKDGDKFVDVRKFVKGKGQPEGTFTQHTTSGISLPLENKDDYTQIIAMLMSVGEAVFAPKATPVAPARKPRHKTAKRGA